MSEGRGRVCVCLRLRVCAHVLVHTDRPIYSGGSASFLGGRLAACKVLHLILK